MSKKDMTPDEALKHTLEFVKELQEQGISVSVVSYNMQEEDKEELLAMYGPGGTHSEFRADPSLWCRVCSRTVDAAQADEIRALAINLSRVGVFFDSSGMGGQRDWELDWSFKYKPGEDSSQREEALNSMEGFSEKWLS